ncbi:MAG: uroporphyrinogen decarboxylase [Anaerolineae bacterium]|nr:uroporphyrinogen decarboxylase [Anaerolineae bacterium]
MNKRERLEKTLAGEAPDRIPVALWRHWPGDDQRAADLAQALVDFQKRWDFDFVKVSPASSYCLLDYGVQDRWAGNIEGTRDYTRRVINRPLDWTELRRLDPTKGSLGLHQETLRLVQQGLEEGTPCLHTIFSPLAQAKNLAGWDQLLLHLRRDPQRLKTGLNIITENTLRYIEALAGSGIAGIFYAIQHASYGVMSEAEYREFGMPYDLRILNALPPSWWFNMVHLHGEHPFFDLITGYPVQAINWHDRETEPDLRQGKARFGGAVCGGLGRWDVHSGTPAEVRQQAIHAIEQTNGRRLILSTGCVMLTTTPQANIRAIRQVVEEQMVL